ncbi:hypothetical protein TSOC_011903 [Tetrabaena socialis]|uniref:Uncharacterized protein n=1 Tax=Tetrabaena socialis TaxID=47790 RepID=A0A2J7ZPF8_9CHLO|nr:hypothetical protein TSOC_011903 [Tetrabaena socialis]|eukprot:PNH02146.1 hypothetical protein TSOC_011903 [Tetrabaena socialis]
MLGAVAVDGLIEVPPTHMKLESSPGARENQQGIQLKPGTPFTLSVRLYNGLQQPVRRALGMAYVKGPAIYAGLVLLGPQRQVELCEGCSRTSLSQTSLGNFTDVLLCLVDTLVWQVTASLEPADPNGADATNISSTHILAKPTRAWQDAKIAIMDPGVASGGSLTASVHSGAATWSTLTVRGWPGMYMLVFDAASLDDIGLYQVFCR